MICLIIQLPNNEYRLTYIILSDTGEEEIIIDPLINPYIRIGEHMINIIYSASLSNIVADNNNTMCRIMLSEIVEQKLQILDPLTNSSSWIKFNTNHVLIKCNSSIYELYYDINTNVLVHGIILDNIRNREYEIYIKYRPSKIPVITSKTTMTTYTSNTNISTLNSLHKTRTRETINTGTNYNPDPYIYFSITAILLLLILFMRLVLKKKIYHSR